MSESHSERLFVRGALTFAGIAAFFVAPLVPYTNLTYLTPLGIGLASFAAGLWMDLGNGRRGAIKVSLVGAGILTIIMIRFIAVAAGDYQANETRCAALQSDMLAPLPKRADSATLFQALGCHARGDDLVSFPSRAVDSTVPLKQPGPSLERSVHRHQPPQHTRQVPRQGDGRRGGKTRCLGGL